ncbi:hypothetical protein TNCV_3220601 [Trichonephila clavipes]|nr:hypothetical protein TNCV_3220601 [Trichonephila clavipes]
MYQDKLANLKKQLKQLEDGVHPDYLKRLKRLEQNFQNRQLLNEVFERVELFTRFQQFKMQVLDCPTVCTTFSYSGSQLPFRDGEAGLPGSQYALRFVLRR